MNRYATVALATMLLGLGCTSAGHDDGPTPSSSAVQVIRTDQIGSRQYNILEVLEDSEMIAGSSHGSVQAQVTARLQKQAAKLGADAIIVTCSTAQQNVVSCRGAAITWKSDG